jgi:hypothetical protein
VQRRTRAMFVTSNSWLILIFWRNVLFIVPALKSKKLPLRLVKLCRLSIINFAQLSSTSNLYVQEHLTKRRTIKSARARVPYTPTPPNLTSFTSRLSDPEFLDIIAVFMEALVIYSVGKLLLSFLCPQCSPSIELIVVWKYNCILRRILHWILGFIESALLRTLPFFVQKTAHDFSHASIVMWFHLGESMMPKSCSSFTFLAHSHSRHTKGPDPQQRAASHATRGTHDEEDGACEDDCRRKLSEEHWSRCYV